MFIVAWGGAQEKVLSATRKQRARSHKRVSRTDFSSAGAERRWGVLGWVRGARGGGAGSEPRGGRGKGWPGGGGFSRCFSSG